jgi:hypothetical protein
MAYTSMTITSVSGGSITSADADVALRGQVTADNRSNHEARTVTVQASSDVGTTWTDVGTFNLPAWDPPGNGNGNATQAWSGTISAANFANLNDTNFVFRAQMPSGATTSGTTLTSSNSAAIPVDTSADAAPTATVAFTDTLVNATEASATPYTVSG